MQYTPIVIPPGVVRGATSRATAGRWHDASLVRWRAGVMRPIGGWERINVDLLSSTARTIYGWVASNGSRQIAVGCDAGFYSLWEERLLDITPEGFIPDETTMDVGGYGVGAYGDEDYGTGRSGGEPPDFLISNLISLDNFGERLLAMSSTDGRLYVYDPAIGPDQRLTEVIAPAGKPEVPISNRAFLVSPERHVIVIGAGGNPRRVAWCSREDYFDWDFPSLTNTAGFLDLDASSPLLAIKSVKGGSLIFTATEVFHMKFIGSPFTYGIEKIESNTSLISPYAVETFNGKAMWMSRSGFSMYDSGYVKPVPCDVMDYIINDIDPKWARLRSHAVVNNVYKELTWFYCSNESRTRPSGNGPILARGSLTMVDPMDRFAFAGQAVAGEEPDAGLQARPDTITIDAIPTNPSLVYLGGIQAGSVSVRFNTLLTDLGYAIGENVRLFDRDVMGVWEGATINDLIGMFNPQFIARRIYMFLTDFDTNAVLEDPTTDALGQVTFVSERGLSVEERESVDPRLTGFTSPASIPREIDTPEYVEFPASLFLANDSGEGRRLHSIDVGDAQLDAEFIAAFDKVFIARPVTYDGAKGYEFEPQDTSFSYTITNDEGEFSTSNVAVQVNMPVTSVGRMMSLAAVEEEVPPRLLSVDAFLANAGWVGSGGVSLEPGMFMVCGFSTTSEDYNGDPNFPPRGSNPFDPFPGWTVIAKSQPHDRLATTLAYRQVTQEYLDSINSRFEIKAYPDQRDWQDANVCFSFLLAAKPGETWEDICAGALVSVVEAPTSTVPTISLPEGYTYAQTVITRPYDTSITTSGEILWDYADDWYNRHVSTSKADHVPVTTLGSTLAHFAVASLALKPMASNKATGDLTVTDPVDVFSGSLTYTGEPPVVDHNPYGLPDAYVTYNYEEGWWSIGRLSRTAGIPVLVNHDPIMAGPNGELYRHEVTGKTAFSSEGAGAIYATSGAVEPAEGGRLFQMNGLYPDSESGFNSTEFTFRARLTPETEAKVYGPYLPRADGYLDCRFSARDVAFEMKQVKDGNWTFGKPGADLKPRGRR